MPRSRRAAPKPKKPLSGPAKIGLILGAVAIVIMTAGSAYAMQLENHDDFCASCHTQPEVKYYQQSLQGSSTTLAAFHRQKNVACIDCHSGGGIFGRATGLSQGTQDLIAYYSGHYHAPAITINKLGDDSCTKCHSDVFGTREFNNHFHFFLSRWQSVDPNAAHCVDCHPSHPTGDPSQGYMSQNAVEQVCQNCHTALGAGE